jgi:hypothetical protein
MQILFPATVAFILQNSKYSDHKNILLDIIQEL